MMTVIERDAHLCPPFIRIVTDGLAMGCAIIRNSRADIRSRSVCLGQSRSYRECLNIRFMIGYQGVSHGEEDETLVFRYR